MIRLLQRSITSPAFGLGLFAAGLCLGAVARFEPALASQPQRAGQEQGQGEQEDDKQGLGYPWNRINAGKKDQLLEDVQGVWLLTDVRSSELVSRDREINGVALVTPEYFAFEMHMEWFNREDFASDAEFQSGIHEMEINSSGSMVLNQLIGAGLDTAGYIQFLPNGERRVYRVDLRSDTMILSRSNGGSFTFRRLRGTGNTSKYDLFGRRVKDPNAEEEEEEETDAPEETPLERWRRERREKLEKEKQK